MVSKSAAELIWPGQDPIGRRFQQHGDSVWMTVVGEVGDVMQYGFRDTPPATLYLPLVGPDADELGADLAGVRREDAAGRA